MTKEFPITPDDYVIRRHSKVRTLEGLLEDGVQLPGNGVIVSTRERSRHLDCTGVGLDDDSVFWPRMEGHATWIPGEGLYHWNPVITVARG